MTPISIDAIYRLTVSRERRAHLLRVRRLPVIRAQLDAMRATMPAPMARVAV